MLTWLHCDWQRKRKEKQINPNSFGQLHVSSYFVWKVLDIVVIILENSALSFLSCDVPELVFSVGEKRLPPSPSPVTSRGLYNPSAGQPVGHMIDWLLPGGGGNNPTCSRTQMSSVFTGLRNYRCQKQFIIPFTHRVGGRVKILKWSWIHLIRRFQVSPVAA